MAERQRTLKRAIDLRDFSSITAEHLLSCGLEFCQQVRRQATLARSSDMPFVCGHCGWPVYVTKNGLTKEYLWAHFAGASQTCEWFTGKNLTPHQVGALQFGGTQESPLHFRLKNLVGELLELDPSADDVVIDARLDGRTGHRRPDVRASYDGRPVALKIQLSSTQLPTILGREQFYTEEGRSLLWIAWSPSLNAKADVPQALLDIYTAHNDNLFSIDEESICVSRQTSKLTLRVHWWDADRCLNKLVTLDNLTYPRRGLPFAVDRPPAWHESFKRRWLSITTPDGSDGEIESICTRN